MMRVYRVEYQGAPRHVVEEDGRWRLVEGDIFGRWTPGDTLGDAPRRFLPPVLPSKIVAIGLNYKEHAAEQGKAVPAEPMMFLKPPTAVVGPGEAIVLPGWAGRIDHEAEVGIVIGRTARGVGEADALTCVFGITCVNDVTARDLQKKDVQYTRAKGFDTFAPIGPCIATGIDPGSPIRIEGLVNGELRQSSSTADLIFGIPRLIAHISAVMTLLPGDIISTGTPAGVGPLTPGDLVTVRIEGVGDLMNPVR